MKSCRIALLAVVFLSLFSVEAPLAEEKPTPSPETKTAQPSWAIDIHGGSYSLDKLLDFIYEKHPSVKGPTAGVALHNLGESGPERAFRFDHVVAFDYAKAKGKGTWQSEPGDKPEYDSVDLAFYSLTYTALWHLFPTARVNPYLGVGFGAGVWQEEAVLVLPVLYLPVGLNAKLTDRVWAHVEASLPGLATKKWSQYYVGGVKVLF